MQIMVSSSAWWMCLPAFTKRRTIGSHFSEVQPLINSLIIQQAVSLLWDH